MKVFKYTKIFVIHNETRFWLSLSQLQLEQTITFIRLHTHGRLTFPLLETNVTTYGFIITDMGKTRQIKFQYGKGKSIQAKVISYQRRSSPKSSRARKLRFAFCLSCSRLEVQFTQISNHGSNYGNEVTIRQLLYLHAAQREGLLGSSYGIVVLVVTRRKGTAHTAQASSFTSV